MSCEEKCISAMRSGVLGLLAMCFVAGSAGGKEEKPPYLDPAQAIETRVEDLLRRMTLQEKIGQLNMPVADRFAGETAGRDEAMAVAVAATRVFAEGTFAKGVGPGGGLFTLARLSPEPRKQAELANDLQRIAREKTRLKIPLLFTEEGTHGLIAPGATIFPEGPTLGSTWNMELIRQVYTATAKETRAVGSHQMCTLVVELTRDPRLGRNMEGYTEDPFLGAEIARAVVTGAQGAEISSPGKAVAVLSHYPGQGESLGGRERSQMEISERTLRETYLRPWVAGIKEAGALAVMAMHPSYNGVPTHASKYLLTDVLRDELGFDGLVLSEGRGIETIFREKVVATRKEAGALAIQAGVDVSISSDSEYRDLMVENVNEGIVPIAAIDRAVKRILQQKFRLGLFEEPYVNIERVEKTVRTTEHQQLALRAAREGIVLLKNDRKLLPLDRTIQSIAVIGPNADHALNLLGDYFHKPVSQEIVTILAGIKKKIGARARVNYVQGCNVLGTGLDELSEAQNAARNADVAIVVVGENERYAADGQGTDGEGNDVHHLDLTGMQEALVKAVFETGTPTVVVLVNGRPLSIRWAAENIPAIVEAWIPGEKGGDAVADVLFGDYDPSGRLSVTFPRHVGQVPVHYNYKPRRVFRDYVELPATPLFDFGHGLSYTTFAYGNLNITPKEVGVTGEVTISVEVKNTGDRKGAEVVQLYINDVISTVVTPVIELKGFEKIELDPGESRTVKFRVTSDQLSLLDSRLTPVVEPGDFEVMVGASSKDIRSRGSFSVH